MIVFENYLYSIEVMTMTIVSSFGASQIASNRLKLFRPDFGSNSDKQVDAFTYRTHQKLSANARHR